MKTKLALNIPINSLGYGIVGTNIAESLLKQNVDLHVFPIGQIQTNISDKLKESINNAINDYDKDRDIIKIWHQHDLMNRPNKGKFYGWPIFELDTFAFLELGHLKSPDVLIVCSKWARSVIQDQTNRWAEIIPLGVDTAIFSPGSETKSSPYKFYTIGKLEFRKGHEFIISCFNKAFDINDDVELNMMVHNVFLNKDITEKWYQGFKNTKLGSKINISPPVNTHQDVAKFINSQDCGLFPSRAEGWNLELLESMACGKPVIATDYSGHTEFCNKDNAYLIDITDKEKAYDKMGGMWFRGQGSWAELDYEQEEQMINYMRYCYENHISSNTHGVNTAHKFSWDNTVNKLLEVIN